MRLAFLVVVFTAFTAFSLGVTATEGYTGFLTLATREKWHLQVLLDLGLALLVAWSWLRVDARERGIRAWPYIVGTVFLGSIAVLAYLIHRELKSQPAAAAPQRQVS